MAERRLKEMGLITDADVQDWREGYLADIDGALSQASKEPTPDPFRESWRALSTTELVEGQFEA